MVLKESEDLREKLVLQDPSVLKVIKETLVPPVLGVSLENAGLKESKELKDFKGKSVLLVL